MSLTKRPAVKAPKKKAQKASKVDRRRGNKIAPGASPEKQVPLAPKPPIANAPVGRPESYRPEFAEMLREYCNREPFRMVEVKQGRKTVLKRVPNLPPTLARFATMIGVCRDTIYRWATEKLDDGKTLKHPEFSDAVSYAKAAQEACFMEGGAVGVYNPFLTQFALKNYSGLKDKTESEQVMVHKFGDDDRKKLDDIYNQGKAASAALNATVGK